MTATSPGKPVLLTGASGALGRVVAAAALARGARVAALDHGAVEFPATDYAFIYLSGGLVRFTHNGVPDIENRYFNDWDVDPTAKTVEALSNRIHIAVVEFK